MTADRYRVEPDQLDRHASRLGGVADQLSSVATRLPDGLGDQPLGAFADFLTAGLRSAMGTTAETFAQAASATDVLATGMNRTAEQYRQSDDQNAAAFSREDLV